MRKLAFLGVKQLHEKFTILCFTDKITTERHKSRLNFDSDEIFTSGFFGNATFLKHFSLLEN